jgi:hypothetical protein
MSWLAVDEEGTEFMYEEKPVRLITIFVSRCNMTLLPKGSIKRLIGDQLLKTHGRDHLTWDDEPVKFTGVVE